MKNNFYLNDNELTKEIIISQGKGRLTYNGFYLLYKLCYEINKMFNYKTTDIRYDVLMESYLIVITGYEKFNYNKYDRSFPYFTEIIKRAHTNSLLKVNGLKRNNQNIKFISLF